MVDDTETFAMKLEHNANVLNLILNDSGGGENFNKILCYII